MRKSTEEEKSLHSSRCMPLRTEKQPSKENTLLGCKLVLLVF